MTVATMAITVRKRTRLGIAFRVPIRNIADLYGPPSRACIFYCKRTLIANVGPARRIEGAQANTPPVEHPPACFCRLPSHLVTAHRSEYDRICRRGRRLFGGDWLRQPRRYKRRSPAAAPPFGAHMPPPAAPI